jgi:lipoprotein-anchoring transpeptidase ErfK/SrfK
LNFLEALAMGFYSTGFGRAAPAYACVILLAAAVESAPAEAREAVSFPAKVSVGTIVVKTGERRLYYVVGDGRALRYPVGVGKAGMQWAGKAHIDGKYIKPAWASPSNVSRVIPGGSPSNPMGVAALTLSGGEYAIHGTNRPDAIGGFVSSGCIRMYNQDVMDLYQRVSVGTPVVVTR